MLGPRDDGYGWVGHGSNEVPKRVAFEQHIGVGERDDLAARMREGRAEGGQFAPLSRQFDDLEAFITGHAGSVRCVVGATVADNGACVCARYVILFKDIADFRANQFRLVMGGDHDGHEWSVVRVSDVWTGPGDRRRPYQRGIAYVGRHGNTDQRTKPE